ncbi:MAG: GntR family transcriptional regulator [Muribaculaceae bacterium]|nr:GntR family transcriptional regulator [Muribaculaceae bacterium]
MIFEENNKAIYLQIADRISDEILNGKYGTESRIPSVREYAASVEVNANTVVRSYERLTSKGLIYQKRGIGFFVAPDAREKILKERSEELISRQLPPLFKTLKTVGITPEQLKQAYADFLSKE